MKNADTKYAAILKSLNEGDRNWAPERPKTLSRQNGRRLSSIPAILTVCENASAIPCLDSPGSTVATAAQMILGFLAGVFIFRRFIQPHLPKDSRQAPTPNMRRRES